MTRNLQNPLNKTMFLPSTRLDFQPFSEPDLLAPHHGWITGLPIVFFDQSEPSLLKSSRLPCDWSILSLVYPTWRISVGMSFLPLYIKVCVWAFPYRKFRETQQEAIVNLLEGKDVFSFTANDLKKNRNFQSFLIICIFDSMLHWRVWFTSCSLATSA